MLITAVKIMSQTGDGCWQLPRQGVAKPILLVAAAALVDPDGRVLIAKRPARKPMGGLWEFPGGKVDAGESDREALARDWGVRRAGRGTL